MESLHLKSCNWAKEKIGQSLEGQLPYSSASSKPRRGGEEAGEKCDGGWQGEIGGGGKAQDHQSQISRYCTQEG